MRGSSESLHKKEECYPKKGKEARVCITKLMLPPVGKVEETATVEISMAGDLIVIDEDEGFLMDMAPPAPAPTPVDTPILTPVLTPLYTPTITPVVSESGGMEKRSDEQSEEYSDS